MATQRQTILVVDDDAGLVRLISKSLKRSGLDCITAQSGNEALALLDHASVDLMLLDLKLPDINGRDLLERLSAKASPTPFIVITGQGDERVAVEMMKSGALDYLVKDSQFLEFVPLVVQRTLSQLDRESRLTQAEEALRHEHAFSMAVFKAAAALMVVVDSQGKIISVNPACETLTGFSIEQLQGKDFHEIFLSELNELLLKEEMGSIPIKEEASLLTTKGESRLITWSLTSLKNEQGEVIFFIASGMDITERRRLEQEILEVSDREQKRIGQDLHDGLCQVLAGIDMLTTVLKNKLSSQAPLEARDADVISGYVRSAITQARMVSRGLSPVELETHGLMAALEELAAATEKLFQVRCEFVCEKTVLIREHARATHLYRIAQEAITNAVKHGEARHIRITLTENAVEGILTIEDDGKGMTDSLSRKTSQRPGMGLRTMNYRTAILGATLTIQPNPVSGTKIICRFSPQN